MVLLSKTRYLIENINTFSLVKFYKHYDFETRQDGEYAIKVALYTLRKKRDRNGKSSRRLNEFIELIEKDDYKYLSSSAAQLHWSKLETRNMILLKAQTHIQFQAEHEIEMIQSMMNDKKKK